MTDRGAAAATTPPPAPSALAVVLWLLLGLFFLRVAGQVLVVFLDVRWLPPEEEWMSGALAYPALFASQLIILGLFGKVCADFTRGRGLFVRPRRIFGTWLLTAGALYLAVMVVRYTIRMSLYPEERWAGGSIPIFLHWVLASFVLLVAAYHWRHTRGWPRAPRSWRARWGLRAGKAALGMVVLACLVLWVTWQLAPTLLARQLDARSADFAVRTERGVTVITADGVRLTADVYHPRRAGPTTPTILVRIPGNRTLPNRLAVDLVGRMWAERGYTVVVQGVRGRFGSGGDHYPFRNEREDGKATLRWLSEQPWWNGRLGMWGGSYFAYTQWVLADQQEPGPSALILQIASSDNHAMFYPGGAFSLESAVYWAVRSHGESDEKPSIAVMEQGFQGFPPRQADDRAVGDVGFFNDWVDHTERDAYWEAADGRDRPATIQAPALLMAGWYDPYLPAQLRDFADIRQRAVADVVAGTRLVVGPWTHARTVSFPDGVAPRNYRLESIAPAVDWFDQHLRGAAGAPTAPVRIYVMGEHTWRDEQEWPLARTRYTPYYLDSSGHANTLHGDGGLGTATPADTASDTYVYDPRDPVPSAGGAMLGPRSGIARQNEVERRDDVLVYTSPPLEWDVEVTGPVKLVLFVSTTAPSTDFTAKLADVYPDGAAYNVSEGILRRAYEGTAGPVEVEVELWPTSMLFRVGHRIRLEVSSSNYPRFDRNPNTGRPIATETAPVNATQTIYHGPAMPSRLILPIIPR